MQSSRQIVTTNKPTSSFLQARCPSCRPTNSVDALKGKYHIPWTCLPQAHQGVFKLLSLTTNSSWLPWGGLPCGLISPLMPGCQSYIICCSFPHLCKWLKLLTISKLAATLSCPCNSVQGDGCGSRPRSNETCHLCPEIVNIQFKYSKLAMQ